MTTVSPGARVVALRTPTLPPATHTNTVLLGEREVWVVDPASPWEDEQGRLLATLDAAGLRVRGIMLSHHHHDHVGGVMALRDALAARGEVVPVLAHLRTAALVDGQVDVTATLAEGDVLAADDRAWDVLHTPGHAPGHLVLHDRVTGTMFAGDMVAGEGTILIDPSEGDLGDYLHHLRRMASRGPERLIPSHGPVLEPATAVLAAYVAHREARTDAVRAALHEQGEATAASIAAVVYAGLPVAVAPIAAMQVTAHLRWLEGQGEAVERDGRWRPQGSAPSGASSPPGSSA